MNKLQELQKEESDLKIKLDELYDYTQSNQFSKLQLLNRGLILAQLEAMRTYWRCLVTRIAALVN